MFFNRFCIFVVAAVGLGVVTYACGDGDGTVAPTPDPPRPAMIVVAPATVLAHVGATEQLTAEVRDQNGNVMARAEVSWSSSAAAVATVSNSGLVTAVRNGTATIQAVAQEARGTSEITVHTPDRADWAALVALYNATDGPNWFNNKNWLTDAPLWEWYGVETDPSGRVVRLDLSENGLTGGPIPPELGRLARLELLELPGNDLSGAIPAELGGLTKLTDLNLFLNKLSGPIPPELGRLARLELLELRYNDLSGAIPAELGDLANLIFLGLERNDLTGPIPPELGDLANLSSLGLERNDLTGPIPPELGDIANLKYLELGSNALTGPIPAELGRLTNLEELHLFDNDLSGPIPPDLSELGTLTTLRLAGTDVCVPGVGQFTRWIDGMELFDGSYCNEADAVALESLHESAAGEDWINSSGWMGGPALDEWHGVGTDALGRVATLNLAANGLAGRLPQAMGHLAELTELRIGDNSALAGRLPISLTRLSLSVLQYAGTDLCSPPDDWFRAWLGGIASHEGTGAECAPLSDRDVLVELYNTTNGPYWVNSDNWLTDTPLSEWYGVETDASGRVSALDLPGKWDPHAQMSASHGLSGPIPSDLAHLAHLTRLNLRRNELSGPLPPELSDLANLRQLELGSNALTGPIPAELGRLTNLEELHLFDNDLSGPIPPELGSLANLWALELGHNDLSGPIPPELGSLANLTYLELRYNELSGPIPPELGRLTNLEALGLLDNDLSGPIPPELGSLANLSALYLDWNDLSGPIPAELGRLTNLEALGLLDNDLSGPVPPEFGNLVSLEELDLTKNAAISGALPASVTNLRSLEGLYARGTGLCAPDDDSVLRAWLDGVRDAHIATCAPAAAYLVQATQSRDFPVPLVAGEEALLRVFVTANQGTEARMPSVLARFYLDGAEAYVTDIPAGSSPIPAEVDESSLSNSANAVIPAEIVRPGLEMVMEIDPDGTLDPGLGVAERIPATGRLAVDVRGMPRFDLTVIPFLWASEPDSSVIGFAEAMSADPEGHELLAVTRTLLPVGDLTVTAHSPVTSSSNSGFAVLRETAAIRAIEGGGSHHMGMMAQFRHIFGAAYVSHRVSVSIPSPATIAHELGHNMGLLHAPCGRPAGLDPRYPYPVGSIGAYGYDFPGEYDVRAGGGPVRPRTYDLMSYCGPNWISDYHFVRALNFRLEDEGAPSASPQRSILVWGGVDEDGTPFLEPAFVVDAPPSLPDAGGDYEVIGRTAVGGELFSVAFAMPETADADGASSFAFVVPAESGWEDVLASLALSGPASEATLDRGTNRPMAIMRDPDTGEVRGFLRDLPPETRVDAVAAMSHEPGLEVLFSRGLPDAAAWRR